MTEIHLWFFTEWTR